MAKITFAADDGSFEGELSVKSESVDKVLDTLVTFIHPGRPGCYGKIALEAEEDPDGFDEDAGDEPDEEECDEEVFDGDPVFTVFCKGDEVQGSTLSIPPDTENFPKLCPQIVSELIRNAVAILAAASDFDEPLCVGVLTSLYRKSMRSIRELCKEPRD